MNTLPTYNEQFNKITEAYIRGEIQPFDPCFCFCGTLCNNSSLWWGVYKSEYRSMNSYKAVDFVLMEAALFKPLQELAKQVGIPRGHLIDVCPNDYEDKLFSGMVAALEVLKQIHIERGETIDAPLVFIQRPIIEPCK